MEKKSRTIIIILSVIIGLLVLGIIGYIIYDNPFYKPKVEEKKKVKKVKKENPNALKEEEKDEINGKINDYIQLAFEFPIADIDELDDQKVFWFSATKIDDYMNGFTKETLEQVISKYFKDDISLVYGDINCSLGDGVFFKYNSETGKYTFTGTHGHGGGAVPRGKIFVEDMTKEDDVITVKSKIVYGEQAGDTFGPIINYYTVPKYDDQNDSNKVYNLNNPEATNYKKEITEEEFNTIKDKVPYTIFKFKISEDTKNYGLVSVTIKDA